MVDFSVGIRTYNGEKQLPELLERLRSQRHTDDFSWEVVVVDNNSTDNTAQIIQGYQANWPETVPLRYILETQQGASYARQRLIQTARGTFIGFLDDDNLPDSDWVAEAYRFGQAHPQAGAYGSKICANYEVDPPAGFERIAQFLPIVERQEPLCFTSSPLHNRKGVLPPGAGLTIRRQVWLDSVPNSLRLKGPVGTSLAAKGEDTEALYYVKKAGWEIWFNPTMKIEHYIPKQRMERDYLLRFMQGVGLGRYHTRMLQYAPWQRPAMTLLYSANDLRKFVAHWLKYRPVLDTDPVAACELELLRSSLLSPWHQWQAQRFNR